MATTILVSTKKFLELKEAYSAKIISEKERVKDVVQVEGISYCITTVQPAFVNGYRLVMLTEYKGSITPLTWKDHKAEIEAGRRARSYDGLMIKYRGAFAVLTGEYVRFEMNNKKLEQLSLF